MCLSCFNFFPGVSVFFLGWVFTRNMLVSSGSCGELLRRYTFGDLSSQCDFPLFCGFLTGLVRSDRVSP